MTAPEAAPAAGQGMLSGWRYRAVVLSALVATLAYVGLTLWGGRENTLEALRQIGGWGICIALALSLVNYGLRFARWQIYLREMGSPVPTWPSLRIYFAGFALTTTPAKAGEALRSLFLRPWGVSYTTSLMALLSERMSDVLAILVLSMLGFAAYPDARPLVVFGIAGIVGTYFLISSRRLVGSVAALFKGEGRIAGLVRRLADMILHARACHMPKVLIIATLLSVVAWGAEAWAFHLILERMNADVGLTVAMSIYAISMLAGALSFMPGGLGGAEAAMIALLKAAGVDTAEAISATIIIRLATLWFAVGIGMIAMAGVSRAPNPAQDAR